MMSVQYWHDAKQPLCVLFGCVLIKLCGSYCETVASVPSGICDNLFSLKLKLMIFITAALSES